VQGTDVWDHAKQANPDLIEDLARDAPGGFTHERFLEAAEAIGMKTGRAEAALERLHEAGEIWSEGTGPGRRYRRIG